MKVFDPETWLKLHLPANFRKKLLTRKLTLKDGIIKSLLITSAVDKKGLEGVIFESVDKYLKKLETLKEEENKHALAEATNGEKMLKTRIENYLIYEESQQIKKENMGKRYIWLPSSAEVPRPEHQLKYGKEFIIGQGEFPNEAYGCKCGFTIID